jgi:beta-glucosidase/6-phospho-beta-glucosidase/beta-galactosidase
MRQRLGDRLPKFSEKDREFIRNKIDFIGLNNYTSRFIAHKTSPQAKQIHFYHAQQTEIMGTMLQLSMTSLLNKELFIEKNGLHNLNDAGLPIKTLVRKQQT